MILLKEANLSPIQQSTVKMLEQRLASLVQAAQKNDMNAVNQIKIEIIKGFIEVYNNDPEED